MKKMNENGRTVRIFELRFEELLLLLLVLLFDGER
jgi:hypothetical protein